MVNEIRIAEIKESAKNLEKALRNRHLELSEKGTTVSTLNSIREYVIKLQSIQLESNIENVSNFSRKYNKIRKEVYENFGIENVEALPTSLGEEKPVEVEEVVKPTEVIVEKKNGAGFCAIALSALAGLGVGIGLASCNTKQNAVRKSSEETVEVSENGLDLIATTAAPVATPVVTPTVEPTIVPTATPVATETEEVNEAINLVLGEYGTFLDISNNEQLEARANYIYDNYYSEFINKLSETEQAQVNPTEIANVIRVMNGELPLDAEGNVIMNANIVDEYAQKFTWLTGDLGSSPELNSIYHIPAHLFTTDNTELSAFIKSYDDIYEKITEGRNNRDGEMTRNAIAELGHKFWNEWHCQGMYGDVNPYNFDADLRLNAYLSSFARYAAYAFEYNLNAMQPVCVDVCIDYETKEIKQLTVNEIFVGIVTGEWDKVIARAAGMETTSTPDSVYFTQDLQDELTWKYNNLQTLRLN